MKFRQLLIPFSFVFYIISEIRNFMFRKDLIKSHKLDCKVISVGNICAGGTGKTPFVNSLIELLQDHFNHICIISRGYGRSSKGPLVVSLKGDLKINIHDAGDEPFMIANRYSNISVVVAEKRILGYNLIKSTKPDLIILDDAYQHQFVKRDLNILLMNGYEPYSKDILLPAGNLRESEKNVNRASCIVETKFKSKQTNHYENVHFVSYKKNKLKINHTNIILVSGIAKPDLFEKMILELNITFKDHLKFNDHYDYKRSDFDQIDTSTTILTTEKDYYKLQALELKVKIDYLQIDFDFPESLNQFILNEILI